MPIGPRSERVSTFGPVGASVFEKLQGGLTVSMGVFFFVVSVTTSGGEIRSRRSLLIIAVCVKVYVVLMFHVFVCFTV